MRAYGKKKSRKPILIAAEVEGVEQSVAAPDDELVARQRHTSLEQKGTRHELCIPTTEQKRRETLPGFETRRAHPRPARLLLSVVRYRPTAASNCRRRRPRYWLFRARGLGPGVLGDVR